MFSINVCEHIDTICGHAVVSMNPALLGFSMSLCLYRVVCVFCVHVYASYPFFLAHRSPNTHMSNLFRKEI